MFYLRLLVIGIWKDNSEEEMKIFGASLQDFKNMLKALGHFYSTYNDFNNLWIQFNKELDRLLFDDFKEFKFSWKKDKTERIIKQGKKSVYIEKGRDIKFNI